MTAETRRTALTLTAMSLGFSVVQLDVTIVNVALPSIGHTYGGGVLALQWMVSAYTVTFAALIPGAGALGDRIGAMKVFQAGFVVFTFASLACALAPSLGLLISARAIQGVGAAILVPNSLALLRHAYEDDKARESAVGLWATGGSLALTAGPILGGMFVDGVGWRSIFLVNLPIGIVGLVLTWFYATETPRSAERELDVVGQITAVICLGALSASTIRGGEAGRRDTWVLVGLVIAVVAACLFLGRERQARQSMLPLTLFRARGFSVTAFAGLTVNFVFYGLLFVLAFDLQRIDRLSPLMTGLAFLPMMGAVLTTNLAAAPVARLVSAAGPSRGASLR
jgi:DHA2 family methylenomycin A resistance protein-like MFS transporter